MEMVWGYVFRAVLGRFGSFSVHFAHIVGARGGAGPRGVPLIGGRGAAWASWRVKSHEKNDFFEKL